MSLEEFLSNKLAQRAAERLLEIIGEASNSMGKEFRARFEDVEWQRVVRLRHLLAHHYLRVDPRQIWLVVKLQIPQLVETLRTTDFDSSNRD